MGPRACRPATVSNLNVIFAQPEESGKDVAYLTPYGWYHEIARVVAVVDQPG